MILLNGWILPIGEASSVEGLQSMGLSRLGFFLMNYTQMKITYSYPPSPNSNLSREVCDSLGNDSMTSIVRNHWAPDWLCPIDLIWPPVLGKMKIRVNTVLSSFVTPPFWKFSQYYSSFQLLGFQLSSFQQQVLFCSSIKKINIALWIFDLGLSSKNW